LPLYLDIHGGGFALGSPPIDDRFCSDFANNNKVLVLSLDYPKAPSYPFPSAAHALVDIVKAVLDDESFPFDRKKVATGGFSTGANLSFAVCQDDDLQGKIGGIVSFYGPLDFTVKTSEKLKTRPANAGPDPLEKSGSMFNWGYISPGQDLKEPLLSVAFALKVKLPPKIYLIGCELDILCRESEVMAERLACEGTREVVKGSDLWEKNGIKWGKALREEHGFDAVPAFSQKKIRIVKGRKEMFESAAEWLFREIYN
jgi:acetyl esterase/lipase